MVDVEGGPGYSTTDSRDYYLELHGRLMDRRDLLLVDLRGTGLSGALDCPRVPPHRRGLRAPRRGLRARSSARASTSTARTRRSTTSPTCSTRSRSSRSTSTATPTAPTSRRRSRSATATRLRSLVLDATYPLPGTDPAFGDLAEATWRALRLVCARRPSCAARGEDPLAVLTRLVERVRAQPAQRLRAQRRRRAHPRARRRDSLVATCPVRLRQPADVPRPARRDPRVRGRRPRAAAAAVRRERARPDRVRRCARSSEAALPRRHLPRLPADVGPGRSAGTAHGAARAARAALPAERFAPFSPSAWTALELRGRDRVPALARPARPDPPVPPAAPYPAVPTLVLNGDLDNITASSGARVVAARFPRSTFVEPPTPSTSPRSATATTAPRRSCGASSAALDAGDTSCADRVKEVRTVDRFPRTCRGRRAGRFAPRRREPAAGAARGGGRRRHGRRRDPALGGQLQRREPRPARRTLELQGKRNREVQVRPRALRSRRRGERDRDVALPPPQCAQTCAWRALPTAG